MAESLQEMRERLGLTGATPQQTAPQAAPNESGGVLSTIENWQDRIRQAGVNLKSEANAAWQYATDKEYREYVDQHTSREQIENEGWKRHLEGEVDTSSNIAKATNTAPAFLQNNALHDISVYNPYTIMSQFWVGLGRRGAEYTQELIKSGKEQIDAREALAQVGGSAAMDVFDNMGFEMQDQTDEQKKLDFRYENTRERTEEALEPLMKLGGYTAAAYVGGRLAAPLMGAAMIASLVSSVVGKGLEEYEKTEDIAHSVGTGLIEGGSEAAIGMIPAGETIREKYRSGELADENIGDTWAGIAAEALPEIAALYAFGKSPKGIIAENPTPKAILMKQMFGRAVDSAGNFVDAVAMKIGRGKKAAEAAAEYNRRITERAKTVEDTAKKEAESFTEDIKNSDMRETPTEAEKSEILEPKDGADTVDTDVNASANGEKEARVNTKIVTMREQISAIAKKHGISYKRVKAATEEPVSSYFDNQGDTHMLIKVQKNTGSYAQEWLVQPKKYNITVTKEPDIMSTLGMTEKPITLSNEEATAIKAYGVKSMDIYNGMRNPLVVYEEVENGITEQVFVIPLSRKGRTELYPVTLNDKTSRYELKNMSYQSTRSVRRHMKKAEIKYIDTDRIGENSKYLPDKVSKDVATQFDLQNNRYSLKTNYQPKKRPTMVMRQPDGSADLYYEGGDNVHLNKWEMYKYDRSQPQTTTRKKILADINGIVKEHNRAIGHDRFAGRYNKVTGTITNPVVGDFETSAHELMHGILDQYMQDFDFMKYHEELIRNATEIWGDDKTFQGYSDIIKAEEGAAECLRGILMGEDSIAERFPQFAKAFTKELLKPEHAELNKKLGILKQDLMLYNNMNPWGKVRACISFSDDTPVNKSEIMFTKEWFAKKRDGFMQTMVDDKNPLAKMRKRVEADLGRELIATDNFELTARNIETATPAQVSALINAKAEDRPLIFKIMNKLYNNAFRNEGTIGEVKEKVNALNIPKETLAEYGAKDNMQAFSTYLVARMAKEIRGREGFEEFRAAAIDDTLADYVLRTAPSEFEEAATLYNNHMHNLVEVEYRNHMITKQEYDTLMKNKFYVPMKRDMEMLEDTSKLGGFIGGGRGFINIRPEMYRLSKKGSSRNILDPMETGIARTYKVLDEVNRNNVSRQFVNAVRQMKWYGRVLEERPETQSPDAKKHIFTVKENGETYAYWTTPEYYDALTNYDMQVFPLWLKIAMIPAQILRLGATGHPAFAATNAPRDTISAAMFSPDWFIPVVDSLKGATELKLNNNPTLKRLQWEFKLSGVPMSTLTGVERKGAGYTMTNWYRSMQDNPYGRWFTKVIDGLDALVSYMQDFNETVEAAPRFRNFVSERMKGKSMYEAAMTARDATINFSRHGSWGRNINRIMPFSNAAIQGMDKVRREMLGNPEKFFARLATWVLMPKFVEWCAFHNNPDYQDIPRWEKANNFVIPVGGNKHIRFAMPQEVVPFADGFLRALEMGLDGDTNAYKDYAWDSLDVLLPDINIAFVRPIYSGLSGFDFYTKRPIVPMGLQGLQPKDQKTVYTTGLANMIGRTFDVSPMKVDAIIRETTGTGGNFLLGIVDNAIEFVSGQKSGRPATYWNEMPFIGRLVITNGRSSKNLDDFYQIYEETAADYRSNGNQAKNAKYWNDMKHVHSQLGNLNKQVKKVMEDKRMDDRDKRDKLDKLHQQIINICRAANLRYNPRKK